MALLVGDDGGDRGRRLLLSGLLAEEGEEEEGGMAMDAAGKCSSVYHTKTHSVAAFSLHLSSSTPPLPPHL